MGAEIKQNDTLLPSKTSLLLELAALDDLDGFISAVENSGLPIDEPGLWYTRRIGSNKMSYEERTPLMVASQYGSMSVLNYIIKSNKSNLNRVSGSDRVTALHCAVAGASEFSPLAVGLLVSASADVDSVDGCGRKPVDLITSSYPKFMKQQQRLNLELILGNSVIPEKVHSPRAPPQQEQQFPVLPDINNGVYSTDEFRMYCFKIMPCSRAYTHDWTECPFAHPGENAKRRDPKKHPYTCVPCPEFKKGACKKGNDCEFAHGVFESWLHPAQYRTRLCKDEIGCSRKVCFFAHRKDELRPVYHSTGSAIPGPEMSSGLSTPPMSPSFSPKGSYSPIGSPSLQLAGSRLRSSLNARDLELSRELLKLDIHHQQQQIQSPRTWTNAAELSPGIRKVSPTRGMDSTVVATAMLNSRAAAFAKRSQSFVDRNGFGTSVVNVSDWSCNGNGKLDWGMIKGEEVNKLRKSNSFGIRGSGDVGVAVGRTSSPPGFSEPDVSWVNSLVKDEPSLGFYGGGRGGGGGGGRGGQVQDRRSPWVEQLYIEQEQLVA